MSVNRIALALACGALVSCQRDGTMRASHDSSGAQAGEATRIARSTAADSAVNPDGSVLLSLDGDGLRIVLASAGSTRLLAFETESEAVITAVSASLGSPASQGTSIDCGGGAMDFVTFADGLSINIQRGRFVGWSARASSRSNSLTTMRGIGVGSTRAALDSADAVRVGTTSLGEEFSAGGIAGVLDGAARAARITALWAGLNCFAR
jgi:hypothetical protein